MKAKVIKIGNSKGIRLPKSLIEQVGLGEEVLLEASKGAIIIRPASTPRENWGAVFEAMAHYGDDKLLLPESRSRWDDEEWEWK